ncbi:phosphate signaling complex protein PhoU [Methylomonas methanica]|uniref:Phosphate-specific transport system accessory protein PhoU n=1 Tax=Methylomonas methanica (strain DSM 25384 / MC09) TaxID=857087 RepID=G0A1K6_METMM|nr:phosphate signaling complex protein PhoU [Methylomonas methanica]AEG00067.1 phosphate uptake regulator, PhoU [Methylomonas methanica MC09]
MSNTTEHLVRGFDNEVKHVHKLSIEMTQLVTRQMAQALQALDEGNEALAEQVISLDENVDQYEVSIDSEVLNILARRNPVASDLRTLLSISKIAVELEKIGNDIVDFAGLVAYLFGPDTSNPNHALLLEISKFGNLVKSMLDRLILVLEKNDIQPAYSLLESERDCQNEFRDGIRQQFDFAIQDARRISRALTLMHMMKVLEGCGEHCCHIAEYMIFMKDSIDIRHGV